MATLHPTPVVHDWPPAGALTTIYTPPPSCSGAPDRFRTSSCMPPNWSSYIEDQALYYSPAICPSGYTSACTRPRPQATDKFGPPVLPSETAIICCPSSYKCASAFGLLQCDSGATVTTSNVVYYATKAPGNYNWQYETRIEPTVVAETAMAIQVRWQTSDLPSLETPPPEVTLAAGGVISVSTTRTSQASSTSSKSKLSHSAIVGIGVTIPLLVIIAFITGLFAFLRYRRAKVGKNEHKLPPEKIIDDTDSPDGSDLPEVVESNSYPSFRPQPPLPHHTPTRTPHPLASHPIMFSPCHHQTFSWPPPPPPSQKPTTPIVATKPNLSTSSLPLPLPPSQSRTHTSSSSSPSSSTLHHQSSLDTLTKLQEQQTRLLERKTRIHQLQRLDEEEERLRRLISQTRRDSGRTAAVAAGGNQNASGGGGGGRLGLGLGLGMGVGMGVGVSQRHVRSHQLQHQLRPLPPLPPPPPPTPPHELNG